MSDAHKTSMLPRRRAFGVAALVAAALLLPAGAHADGAEQGVPEPEGYRTSDYRTPVPATLKGARVINADDAVQLLKDKSTIFVDVYPRAPKPPNLPAGTVWRNPPHSSIEGGNWLPNVGYGVLSAEFEAYFKTRLEILTAANKARLVVFYCQKDCWMSWNAAKRAIALGYRNVAWFPDGIDGWQDIGNDIGPVTPVP